MREAILDRMGFSEADRPALGRSPVSVFPNAESSSGPSQPDRKIDSRTGRRFGYNCNLVLRH
jgi:hypothetical protein